MVALDGPSYSCRPGLYRHRLCEPIRISRGQEAAPAKTELFGQGLPDIAAARAVDRGAGAGADRPGFVGAGSGPAAAQCGPLLPQQHAAQPSAALLADLRLLWLGHVRRQPSSRCGGPAASQLSVSRQRLHADRPRGAMPTRRGENGEALDYAVWEHVRGLLGDPQRLLAQFQDFAVAADQGVAREAAAEHKLRARLESLARADQRLLDAYQAEVISLEELVE